MKISKKTYLLFYMPFLLHISCINSNSQSNPSKKEINSKKMETSQSLFTGYFEASYENASISAELVENQNVVKGYFFMDGAKNELNAISNRNTMTGKIKDKSNNVQYDFTAKLIDQVLHFSITFPELNNQVIELLLTKQVYNTGGESDLTITNGNANIATNETTNGLSSKTNTQFNTKAKDRRLIGTWRYTEVLSSGGYGEYTSLATDYFLQFKANGECLSWIGSSAGGSADVSYDNSENSDVSVGGWYTEGKNVIFYDHNTKEEVSIPFLADENRFLLKGGSTKIYERVN